MGWAAVAAATGPDTKLVKSVVPRVRGRCSKHLPDFAKYLMPRSWGGFVPAAPATMPPSIQQAIDRSGAEVPLPQQRGIIQRQGQLCWQLARLQKYSLQLIPPILAT